MNIILDVLAELHFVVRDIFAVECNLDAKRSINVEVRLLTSDENDSQAYLVVECENSSLVDFVDGNVIKEIALSFRKNKDHRAEMDRNTTLLFVCKHSDIGIDTSSKVKIEDDPYYFKKYVLSYEEKGLDNANRWLKENEKKGSVISLIQEYITDTNHFSKYKINHQNEATYTFFMELVTKLHCFPMKTAETPNYRTVKDFLKNEIYALRNKKNPVEIDLERIENFVESDVDFENLDDICQKWDKLFMIGSEN